MFDNVLKFFKGMSKKKQNETQSKDTAKERLHLVLMQYRANVSADFLELIKQEIIEVIKKYVEVDEKSIDVRLTNKSNDDGTNGAPALYANIPIVNIRNDMKKEIIKEDEKKIEKKEDSKDDENKKINTEKNEIEKENKEESKVVENKLENEKEHEDENTENNKNNNEKNENNNNIEETKTQENKKIEEGSTI